MKSWLLLLFLFILSNSQAQTIETGSAKAATFAIQAAHTALWYNPDENGHGLSVYVLDNNKILVIWYVYDDVGKPLWLLGVGTHDGFTATLDVNQFSGAQFPPNFNATDVIGTAWGTFQLSFSDCDNGLFSWQPVNTQQFPTGQMNVVRLTNTLGLSCSSAKSQVKRATQKRQAVPVSNPTATTIAMTSGLSALWYNPSENGHGINVYMLADNKLVVVWYVYDNSGNPIWLLGTGTHDGFAAQLDVIQGSGANFPPNFNASDVQFNDWGTFNLEFSSCDAGTFKWTPTAGNGFSSGQTNIVRLTKTAGLPCP